MTTTTTFSDLLRSPNDVIERLEDGDVVLTRRGGDPLRLSKERDARQGDEMVSAFAQMIAATILDESSADGIAAKLSVPFAWIEFLSEPERRLFVDEFLRTSRACASVGRFDRLAVVVGGWRETATAYSLGLTGDQDDLEFISGGLTVKDPRVSA